MNNNYSYACKCMSCMCLMNSGVINASHAQTPRCSLKPQRYNLLLCIIIISHLEILCRSTWSIATRLQLKVIVLVILQLLLMIYIISEYLNSCLHFTYSQLNSLVYNVYVHVWQASCYHILIINNYLNFLTQAWTCYRQAPTFYMYPFLLLSLLFTHTIALYKHLVNWLHQLYVFCPWWWL